MNNLMPCGLDDPRIRYEPEEVEVEDPRSLMEIRIEWLCEEWQSAIKDDTYESWRDLRMMVYGATQALNYCRDRHDDRMALMVLSSVSFEHSLACLAADKGSGK